MKTGLYNRTLLFLIAVLGLLFYTSNGQTTNVADRRRQQKAAHFHHVHLNVSDPELTLTFYEKYFGASRIDYRGKSKALFTEKSFIFLDSVKGRYPSNLGSSLWHIGWAGVDGQSEFQWRVQEGIEVQTPVTSLVVSSARPMDTTYYMYFWGPDRELIEIYTGNRNHRFEHVHLLASNIEATTTWFRDYLGLTPDFETARSWHGMLVNIFRVDNVNIIIYSKPDSATELALLPEEVWPKQGFRVTDGTAIDHIGFSYESIEPVLKRMKSSGIPIVRNIGLVTNQGFSSFFVRGPDGLLIEIVKERPVPEGIWFK